MASLSAAPADVQSNMQSECPAWSSSHHGIARALVLGPVHSDTCILPACLCVQVPQYLLEAATDAGAGGATRIVVTQPRRIAAMSVAERVAVERGEPPPGSPGRCCITALHHITPHRVLANCHAPFVVQWSSSMLHPMHARAGLRRHSLVQNHAAAVGCRACVYIYMNTCMRGAQGPRRGWATPCVWTRA